MRPGNVTPQDFYPCGCPEIDATAALREALATGRDVDVPDGIYPVTGPIDKYSIGQAVRGRGVNRTVIIQQADSPTFVCRRAESGANPAYQWRGPYSGGGGAYLHGFGYMTIAARTPGTGQAITFDGADEWMGDYNHVHDLLTFGFREHLYFDSVAQLRVHRTTHCNAAGTATPYGTGIITKGADQNSHVFQGVSISGMDVAADITVNGGQLNFGDLGTCNTGLLLTGSGSVNGGHLEQIAGRYFTIGAHGPSRFDFRGVDCATGNAMTLRPILVTGGSILTGSATGGSGTPGIQFVECTNKSDHANLEVICCGSDNGEAGPESFQFYNAAMNLVRRFSPYQTLIGDGDIPTATAAMLGLAFHVANIGGKERFIRCRQNSGLFEWVDSLP